MIKLMFLRMIGGFGLRLAFSRLKSRMNARKAAVHIELGPLSISFGQKKKLGPFLRRLTESK
jgi:hypothetical protein